jgi:hypothetical protein
MAQQVSVQYVDDLDGSAASGPVDFSRSRLATMTPQPGAIREPQPAPAPVNNTGVGARHATWRPNRAARDYTRCSVVGQPRPRTRES